MTMRQRKIHDVGINAIHVMEHMICGIRTGGAGEGVMPDKLTHVTFELETEDGEKHHYLLEPEVAMLFARALVESAEKVLEKK